MVHSKYSHHHPTELCCSAKGHQHRNLRSLHDRYIQSDLPHPAVLGTRLYRKVQQNKKSPSKEATNITLSNEMCKLRQKLWILSALHKHEITINRKGRKICPPQTRQTSLLKPLKWSEINISCRRIMQFKAKNKHTQTCVYYCMTD